MHSSRCRKIWFEFWKRWKSIKFSSKENVENCRRKQRLQHFRHQGYLCSIEKISITLKSMLIKERKVEKEEMENKHERRSKKDRRVYIEKGGWMSGGNINKRGFQYTSHEWAMVIAKVFYRYVPSALTNIANATVHFRNADDLSRKVP